ncbi:angio-associated migratory cell protein [Nilaparvata lugens]|uniref:angio-associated migratory cell protein n=1 Tax=Nilaparvata lugens TaxID=108931 RepID=UPI000B9921FB|nr:angio-associated migratory cell protein [Nilaparvata lugens]XP_039280822.1 angio-associated migratory cell protein [Nilaparvata lugens]XP_039280823.1 angio-associated migratory cell protein [Nilaparvata lugens]
MPLSDTDTPPRQEMDDPLSDMEDEFEELYEEDLEMVDDGNNGAIEDNDEGMGSDGDSSEFIPERDDAAVVFSNHTEPVFCGNFNKAATLAVTGSQDDKAFIWDTSNGNVISELKNHKDSVVAAEFNYDDTLLATADLGGTIQVWNVTSSELIWSEKIEEFRWMKWHSASSVLLCATPHEGTYFWKLPEGICKVLPHHDPAVANDCGLLMPDGLRAAQGYSDGTLKVFDLKACAAIASFTADSAANCLTAHPDNNLVAVGYANGQVMLYKTNPAKLVTEFNEERTDNLPYAESIRFSPDANLPYLVVGFLTGCINVWDLSKQTLRHRLNATYGVVQLCWDKHTLNIFGGLCDGSVIAIDPRDGTKKAQLLGHKNNILDMTLSTDGSKVLTTSEDKTARIFHIQSLQN